MTDKPIGLKPLDFHADIVNIFEPLVIDNPTEQEEWMKKQIIKALKDFPKPKKTGYLVMTPNEDKIKNIKRFTEEEISFKCELKDDVGFRRVRID